jgi:hypothetical protein
LDPLRAVKVDRDDTGNDVAAGDTESLGFGSNAIRDLARQMPAGIEWL